MTEATTFHSRAMPQEIERKFLVKGEFKSLAVKAVRIKQGYIAPGSGRTVRVRSWDDKGYLTIKGPASSDGLGRFEWEKEISLQDVEDLMTARLWSLRCSWPRRRTASSLSLINRLTDT